MSIELDDIPSGYNLSKLNDNFEKVEQEFNNNTLRRDGVSSGEDNSMEVTLDMNSNDIINLPKPTNLSSPIRLQDFQGLNLGNIIVDRVADEVVTLSTGQKTVPFDYVDTSSAVFYVIGKDSDNGRLVAFIDYTITNSETLELKESYPEGTQVFAIQFDEAQPTTSEVVSVFGRTGAVAALSGDYTSSKVENDSGTSGENVSDALDGLDTRTGSLEGSRTSQNTRLDDLEAFDDTLGTAATKDVTIGPRDTTSDKVLLTGDGGILGSSIILGNGESVDAITRGFACYLGFGGVHASASSGDNPFPTHGGVFSLVVSPEGFSVDSGQYVTQTATIITGSDAPQITKTRTKVLSGQAWSPWVSIHHTGNLISNSVSATAAGQYLMKGFASSVNVIRFTRDITNAVRPSGLTLSAPTDFDIIDSVGASVATGVTPIIGGPTSKNLLVLNVTGLTGLTVGATYLLTSASAQSELSWSLV